MPGINSSLKSYIQWRPIVYNTMDRELSSSTGLTVSQDVDVPAPAATHLRDSIMFLLYGMDLNDVVVKTFNISFGAKDDGFYNKTQYHAWTFTFGTGKPIRNGMSANVLLATIALGLITIVTIIILLGLCFHNNYQYIMSQAAARPAATSSTDEDSGVGYSRLPEIPENSSN